MIAALFVQPGGVYWDLPDVDPWDEARDARKYAGPHPVVAHPPCQRWGRYWPGRPGHERKKWGEDGGCFEAALKAARAHGGVLEHPAHSGAWVKFGLNYPPSVGGWIAAGLEGGWTCCVDQGHYGHRASKATWLFTSGVRSLPSLTWGRCDGEIAVERMGKQERARTPLPFRDLLLSIARSAQPPTRNP